MADDDELDLSGGGDEAGKGKSGGGGETGKRKAGRPSTDAKTSELKKTIEEGLGELAEWLGGELGTELREGAQRMAKVLSARAAKHARVARVLGVVFAPDGPLAILRAFGPFARKLGEKLGALRDREPVQYVDVEGFLVDETGVRILDDDGQPLRGDA